MYLKIELEEPDSGPYRVFECQLSYDRDRDDPIGSICRIVEAIANGIRLAQSENDRSPQLDPEPKDDLVP